MLSVTASKRSSLLELSIPAQGKASQVFGEEHFGDPKVVMCSLYSCEDNL